MDCMLHDLQREHGQLCGEQRTDGSENQEDNYVQGEREVHHQNAKSSNHGTRVFRLGESSGHKDGGITKKEKNQERRAFSTDTVYRE
jgi:hypothetical protein